MQDWLSFPGWREGALQEDSQDLTCTTLHMDQVSQCDYVTQYHDTCQLSLVTHVQLIVTCIIHQ